jgi:hypothetical protein
MKDVGCKLNKNINEEETNRIKIKRKESVRKERKEEE